MTYVPPTAQRRRRAITAPKEGDRGLTLLAMRRHRTQLIEPPEQNEAFEIGHQYLLLISDVDDREVFKVSLEYWNKLVRMRCRTSCPCRPLQ